MKKKLVTRIAVLMLLSMELTFASIPSKVYNYSTLTIVQLQELAETLSLKGELPFEMSQELMKRWSHS